MSVRDDLVAAAAASATAAKDATGAASRREHAEAAKTALEAAALAEGMPPDEIAAALDQMSELLAGVGLDHAWRQMEPGPFLEAVLTYLAGWRDEAAKVEAIAEAYARLRLLAANLERDFIAGDSETSLRVAARIHSALEDTDQLLGNEPEEER